MSTCVLYLDQLRNDVIRRLARRVPLGTPVVIRSW